MIIDNPQDLIDLVGKDVEITCVIYERRNNTMEMSWAGWMKPEEFVKDKITGDRILMRIVEPRDKDKDTKGRIAFQYLNELQDKEWKNSSGNKFVYITRDADIELAKALLKF